jgi:hypothetical protein
MDFFEKIYKIIKLPFHIIVLLSVIAGLLLFLPENIRIILKLNEFIFEFGKFLGIFFIFSIGYILFFIIIKIWNILFVPNEADQKKYINIVLKICDHLLLPVLSIFIDHAPRGIVMKDFIFNQEDFNRLILSTIWPKKYKKIKKLILSLNDAYNSFIKTFLEHSELLNNDYFREIKFYKTNGFNKNYDKDFERYKQWCKKWYYELNYFVYVLNSLIEKINCNFNNIQIPGIIKNKYLIEDSLGVYNMEAKPTLHLPKRMKKWTNGA